MKFLIVFFSYLRKLTNLNFSFFDRTPCIQVKATVTKLLLVVAFFGSATAFSQVAAPFNPRLPGGSIKVKGDIVLIGNNIITGKGLPLPYNGGNNNNGEEGVYVNVASGGDASIFSSSSADLFVDNTCKKILYAGLYWASVYPNEVADNFGSQTSGTPRLNDWNQIKFKLPTGGFIDLVADANADPVGDEDDIIFDGYDYTDITKSFKDSPIICYKNVTGLLQGLTEADGTYTVANQRATRGKRVGGCSAGWTLVVVYESPILSSKYITLFDGYAGVQGSNTLNIPVSGFKTLPSPLPVIANIGVAALEGDIGITGDTFKFKASTSAVYTPISDALNDANNFFNSRITSNGVYVLNRNPASKNTLGLDINNVKIPNPGNAVLPNSATAGDLRLTTSGDGYGIFLASFAVEIIEPKITTTKIVHDISGNDISNQMVNLGDQLNYIIGFQNTGNDNAENLIIRDILPQNIVFNYPADMGLLPAGVTVQSYNAATRELIFKVDNAEVEVGDPVKEIRFKATVVKTCSLLNNACSNIISNQAYVTYNGTINSTFAISDDPSYSVNTGCLITPAATNFLADLDCDFKEDVILCGASTVLTAGGGYDTYSWSTSPTGTPVIGTSQTLTVTKIGTYYVHNTATAPCQSIDQEFSVVTYGGIVINPITPFADEVVECANDGKKLPNIFLCGGNDSRLIETNITDTSSIIWEKLDEASCDAIAFKDCANEDPGCTWNQVATGPNFTADTGGQYRLTLIYPGLCVSQFYFNVYQNLLIPTVKSRDIYCTTPGEIRVGGVPSGYEYSIDGVNYQPSNVFPITTPNVYSVYVRQIGVTTNPCIFSVPDVQIRQRDFTVSAVVTQPLCHDEKGSVKLAANDVRAQYFYSISQGATVISSVGPVLESDYTFANLNPGTYTATISTEDGCLKTVDFEIINPPLLTTTSALTKPLTCANGEVTVYPVGGTPPYYYYVNSTTVFQTEPEIVITTSGVYNIKVFDSKNCFAETSITVNAIPAPVYTVNHSDILCYNSNTGEIQFAVTNANGYNIQYSIDNGTTYVTNPIFSNLGAGTYSAIIKYSLNGVECLSTIQNIIITQPDTTVTASAGVSELAGCGPSGKGKVRITNPQGGTPPYAYSFDNQATWVSTNEAFVAPGTYTLYIKDANGCIYPMPQITLDPEPVAPTITVNNPDFNCDGTANAIVTVNNPGTSSFTYTYLLDGIKNTNTADPKTFLNVPDGSHSISVKYTLATVPTYSNLLYETFGYGNDVTSPGINPTYYCFERQVVATQCKGNIQINDGDYSVTARISSPFGPWVQPGDHTPATVPATPKGRCLVVNIGASIPKTEILYEKYIYDIIPNQPINVEFFAMNLLQTGNTQFDPDLLVALVDAMGNEISSFSTGNIPKTQKWENYPKTPMTLDPGTNTSLKFIVRSNVQQTSGNDVAIDDIKVFQLPKACITTVDFPFIVETGKAFKAQILNATNTTCSGTNDGTITISAQNFDPTKGFQYSIDNGVNWITQLTSPYKISGLAAQSYDVKVRYENVVNTCGFTFVQNITAPTLLEVTATATPITCVALSTVTATATGGSPAYTYELLDGSLNLVANFPANGILTNVSSGNYTVRATDVNGCKATNTLEILDFVLPTATINVTDYCYDATNGASLEVTAADGKAPYEYNINGGAFDSNNIFSNLTPGTYTIIVRDANGCTVTLPIETIENQLVLNTNLTKDLDCTVSPDAVIAGSVSGGYPSYTYAISVDGAGYVILPGNPFPYSAANATATSITYQFQVTDAKGCMATSDLITVNPIEKPTATTTVVNATCNGNTNGSVQIVPSGGVGPYTYSFNGSGFTSTALYPGLAAGTYPYQVKDAKECIFDGSVTITEPTALAVSASATTFSCSASNTTQSAVVTIDLPTTGTAPYTYSFNGSGFTATNTLTVNDNGTSQTINYTVKDANGCTAGGSVTILPLNPPTDLTFTTSPITCLATTSTVTLTAINGVGILQYETLAPSPIIIGKQTSNSFTGLTPGTYIFRVTDANGCYYTESLPISPVTNIAVTGLKVSDVLCNGDNTGAIQFTVSGYAGTYTSSLTSGTGTINQTGNIINLTGLVVGSYSVEVTDTATGCTDTETIIISEPTDALGITATATNVHCKNYESLITAIATGGTLNYKYAAVLTGGTPINSDYKTNNIISVNTSSGANLVWDVYVKDANGCTEKTTVTILQDDLPTVTAPAVSNQCTVASGFTFTVSGTGVAPLQYSINGGASYQTSPTFTVNTAGNYTITIKDGNGCTATSSTATQVYAPITVNALLTDDLSCFTTPDASIAITVSGGKAPYTYEVSSDGGLNYTSIPGSPYTTTSAGTYQFRITDANGCTKETQGVIVNSIVNPEISSVTQIQTISCNSEETGAIDIIIDATKGLAPFVINVTNTTTGTDYGTQTSGLAAGDYTITVTDAKGCTDIELINIAEPDPIVVVNHEVPITCDTTIPGSGVSKGSVIIDSVTGGTPPYNYFVTGTNGYSNSELNVTGTTSVNFDVVDFGLYQINVVDSKGCSVLIQDVLVASPPTDLDINVVSPPADCSTGGSAIVSIGTTLTGSGPFHFAIYTGPGTPAYSSPTVAPWQDEDAVGSKKTVFNNLIPGATYTFIVHDEFTGCDYYETADVPIPTNSTLIANALVANNITCKGSADGKVSFDIVSIYPTDTDVSYEIYNAQSLFSTGITGLGTVPANGTLTVTNLGNLGFGNYVVVIKELPGATNAGCSAVTVPFNITESAIDLSVTASVSKNENCNKLGIISAIAKDGTAPYVYQLLLATDPTPVATSGGWASANTFTAVAGNYIVYVKDAYGCIKQAPVTLTKDAIPTINPVPQQCFDGTSFTITLTGTTFNSTATYSMGGAYQLSPDFTITAAGTYNVSIKDANGCIASDTFIVEPPLLLDVSATELDCVVTPVAFTFTPSGGDGIYTYEVSIGGGPYVTMTLPYTTSTSGNYKFKVIDSQLCEAESTVVTVNPTVAPELNETHVDVSCNGGADGSIVVTATKGVAPYEYSIDGAPFQPSNVFTGLAQGTYNIVVRDSKSCVSTSIAVVIDQPTALVTTAAATPFLCATDNTAQSSLVTIDIPTTGTSSYLYSFNGSGYTSTNTFTVNDNGTTQTIIYSVKDANGCTFSDSVTILPLNPPTDLDFSATPVTCLATVSTVTLTATNGVGVLFYEIISPASAIGNTTGAATGIFTGLAPDTYVFTVTDANGCYYTEAYPVKSVTNITVSGFLVKDITCFGDNDGAVTFEVANFSGTYSYTINGISTGTGVNALTIPLTGLSAGDKTIIVTDDTTGCTATFTVTVSEPIAVSLIELSNINANCNFGAQVTVEASGGTSPYQYAFVIDGSTPVTANYTDSDSAVLNPATSTNWDVWVMDSNGCTQKIDVAVTTDPLPTVTVPTFAINQCTVASGFEFTVTNTTGLGGVGPFTYSIGSGFTSNPTFTVSTPGTYTVTIKDGNGCTATGLTNITIYPALALTPNITTLPSCADNDGVITVTGAGGSGNYNYAITAGPVTVAAQASNVFSGLPAGTYTVTIIDTVTSCTKDASVTLEAPTPVTFTTSPTDVSCNGGNDGTITVNLPASNDNPIYTYEIIAPIVVSAQNSNVFTGLAAGTYTVKVNSGRGCSDTKDVIVGEPALIIVSAPIVVNYGCTTGTNATNYATISVNTVTGGSGTYTKYEFIRGSLVLQSSANNVYTETDLLGGTYTINVYDDKGCSGTETATILPFITLETLNVTITDAITCTNDEDITVSVTSSGGTPTNLEFVLEDYAAVIPTQTNATGIFNDLPIGNYKITVTNLDTGCSLQTVHYISNPNTFDLTVDTVVDVTCFSASDGSVNVTFIDRLPNPTDESGPFGYTVVDALGNPVTSGSAVNAGPITIAGLASGTYKITATLTNSPYCAVSKNFTITAPNAALTAFETHTAITCVSGNNDGSISATATGGWPGGYEFELSGTTITTIPYSSNGSFTNLSAGTYTVSVKDSKGCIDTVVIVLTNPLPITVTASADVTMLNCFNDRNATITVDLPTGGQGSNYLYTLNTILPIASSSGPQISPVFGGLGAGTYTVTVTDGYNCTADSAPITINQPTKVEATLAKTTTQTCVIGTELVLRATGGSGSYEYSVDASFATFIAFTTPVTITIPQGVSGTYRYYVRDANGCSAVVSNDIKIDPFIPLTVKLDTTNAKINCAGDETGVIIATAQGGLGNYIYTLQDGSGVNIPGAVQNSPGVFTELPVGTYKIRVDSGDCDTTTGITSITAPLNPLLANFVTTNVLCAGSNNGLLEITTTGGTGIVKYAISPRLDQFFSDGTFDKLKPGTYQAIAQDELGCFVLYDFVITEPLPLGLIVVPGSIIPEVCEGDLDGEFSIQISGGTAPYSVALDNVGGPYTTGILENAPFDFTGLAGGDHTVYIKDALGCESEWSITFPKSVLIAPEVKVAFDCTNNVSGNTVTVTVGASITNLADLDYSLDGGTYQPSNIFNDVPAGLDHIIMVRHTNGCEKPTQPFDIEPYIPLAVMLQSTGTINELVAETTGGSGNYEYTLNGESYGSTNTFIIYKSGDYTVTVTDSYGCYATATKYFEYIDVCIPNYFTPNNDNNQDEWGPGCSAQYKDLTFDIFDRYGRKIASLHIGQKWDGKYNGVELPTGDYWYVIRLNDKKDDREFVGHFTLYR